jgi:hypothetical protein
MLPKLKLVPRQECVDQTVDRRAKVETEYFMRCPACDGRIDTRDLRQVLEHDGALPHPVRECAHGVAADPAEPELLRAMFDVGYFPPNTPPDELGAISPKRPPSDRAPL